MATKEKVEHMLGTVAGTLAAPVAYGLSKLRGTQVFHPGGECFVAEVSGASLPRLDGSALVRLSSSLWEKGTRLPDILGFAIRFGWREGDATTVLPRHQDLLLVTARSLLTLAPSVLFTRSYDFFANRYYAITPFEVEGWGRVLFRLSPREASVSPSGNNRWERLESRWREGTAIFSLEARSAVRLPPYGPWRKVAEITLRRPIALDHDALRFSPSHTGSGLRPAGLWNATREIVYAGSQRAHAA